MQTSFGEMESPLQGNDLVLWETDKTSLIRLEVTYLILQPRHLQAPSEACEA